MTSFSSWILTIVGSICLTLLIDVLMQEGETKKYVKGITSLIVFTAIITPLTSLFNTNDTNYSFCEQENEVEVSINNDFLYSIKERELLLKAENCEKFLDAKGYIGLKISPQISYGNGYNITNVTIDTKNLIIKTDIENIDIINKELQEEVSSFFLVDINLVSII